ncbi:MAG TPA: holo-ACP synthase [Chryseosolibacter sp.]
MIAGNGVDIVEVSRVADRVRKGNGFREKVFSLREIEYCERSANPDENFAARFAAKEAFLKATGMGMLLGYELNEIEISNDENGKPSITLAGKFADFLKEKGWSAIHVSVSHTQTMACAFVIIEK